MAYEVRIAPAARRALKRIDRRDQVRIVARIELLADDPRSPDAKKLAGMADLYRVRVGDYRIVYSVEEDALVVLVVRIGHRRDVYRGLSG